MLRRVVAAARRAISALGKAPAAVVCVAALAIAVMYCGNDLTDPKKPLPAGDGQYRPAMARGDGHMHFLITRSLVFDGDLDLDNDLARFGDPWHVPRTETGKKRVLQPVGPSLIWAPLLALAHGLASVANLLGADIPTHGYTLFHQRILFASSVVFAWLAIGLGMLLAYRLARGRWAPALAGVATLLGTTVTYYATFMPSYAHAMDAAACAGFLAMWALTLGDRRWRRYLWLGVLLGIAMLVRAQDVTFGCVLALELGIAIARDRKTAVLWLARGAATLAIAVVLFTPQLVVWKSHFGHFITEPQGPGYMRYGHPMILELLFSANDGWLATHPIAYAGVIGLVVGAIAGPRIGPQVRLVCGALLLATAVQVYINACVYDWWGSASFGQRRMCSSTLAIVVGLATLLRWLHVRVHARPQIKLAVAGGVLGFFVAWNLVWVGRLSSAASAGRPNRAPCCDDMAPPMRWVGQPIYSAVGNPFAFPANAWFALKHGVGLRRWDAAVGSYALVPPFLGFIDGSYRKASAQWKLADPYILDGWGPLQGGSRTTTETSATFLLPLLVPEPHRIKLPISTARPELVQIGCNGALVAAAIVGPQGATITFDTDGAVGESTLEIVAAEPVTIKPLTIALP